MSETFADAVVKVFRCALVDAHTAARKDDKEARAKFSAVAEALEAAYPREVRAVYEAASVKATSDLMPVYGSREVEEK